MTIRHQFRRFVQRRFGLNIMNDPLRVHDSLARTVQMLDYFNIDCVVDVGANDGGYASAIRSDGFSGRIISFEPLSKPFASLQKRAANDGCWDVYQYAVGDATGDVTINIAGNSALSSSILPMLNSHADAAPSSRYVDKETVRQDRLDCLLPELGVSADQRTFIKIDVQGYEAAVLDGASGLLRDGGVFGMQLELSLIPLYEGAMTYRDGLDRVEAYGMSLMDVSPVFTDPTSGRLLQADAVFFRE